MKNRPTSTGNDGGVKIDRWHSNSRHAASTAAATTAIKSGRSVFTDDNNAAMLPSRRRAFSSSYIASTASTNSSTTSISSNAPAAATRIVVQRTTSETLRLDRDLELTNTVSPAVVNSYSSLGGGTLMCCKKPLVSSGTTGIGIGVGSGSGGNAISVPAPPSTITSNSSSFIVTGVSPRPDFIYCMSDSPEPDSLSVETPSFSEDTSQSYSRDLDSVDLVYPLLGATAVTVALQPALPPPLLTTSHEYATVSDAVQPSAEQLEAMVVEGELVDGGGDCDGDGDGDGQRVDGRYIGRFKVVKVESMGRFKRGRWQYQDYLDDSPHAPRDGYMFVDGTFVKCSDKMTTTTASSSSTSAGNTAMAGTGATSMVVGTDNTTMSTTIAATASTATCFTRYGI